MEKCLIAHNVTQLTNGTNIHLTYQVYYRCTNVDVF